jgi:hypothetical protein
MRLDAEEEQEGESETIGKTVTSATEQVDPQPTAVQGHGDFGEHEAERLE